MESTLGLDGESLSSCQTGQPLALIQEMYFGDGIQLFKEEDNERYYEEYQTLQSKDNLNATEQTRRDELEDFFDASVVGGVEIDKRLALESIRQHRSPRTHQPSADWTNATGVTTTSIGPWKPRLFH